MVLFFRLTTKGHLGIMTKSLNRAFALIAAFLISGSALAEDLENPSNWLFVHTAQTAEITSETTLIVPLTREILAFSDRPNRMHGYLSGHAFVSLWSEGEGDSFSADPPNAVLTWRDEDGIREVVVVITRSEVEDYGRSIVYELAPGVSLPAVGVQLKNISLFVDSVCIGVCGNKNTIMF